MVDLIKRQWFLVGMAVVIALAFQFPEAGAQIAEWKILKIAIFIAFFISGLSLNTEYVKGAARNIIAVAGAMVSCFVLFPLLAMPLAHLFYNHVISIKAGIAILAVCPVTLVSGIVLTDIAKGNTALSVMICIASNVVAIFTIPLSLSLILQIGQSVYLPVLQMITNLILVVLLPIMLGLILQQVLKQMLQSLHGFFSVFSQSLVLLIVFNAVSASQTHILKLGWNLGFLIVWMIGLHILVLVMNFAISRAIRLDRPATTAFSIQTSQKALVVAYLIWLDFFSVDLPMALIPPAAYHLIQIVIDAFIARRIALHIPSEIKNGTAIVRPGN